MKRCGQKARVLKTSLSNTKPKNWMNVSRGSLPDNRSKGYVAALEQNDGKISTAKDRKFVKCRQVLEGKARALRRERLRKTTERHKSTYHALKMKSSHGKTEYWANTIQNHFLILCGICLPLFWSAWLPRTRTMKCLSKISP